MWQVMKDSKPSVFMEDNDKGAERVIKSNRKFAFFMESRTIDYKTYQNCNLTRVGALLDSKGYGIALPVGKLKFSFMGANVTLSFFFIDTLRAT